MTKAKGETNTVYNYLKRNPSLVIALGSFAVALIAAACKMIEYMKLKIYLNKWGYDISYVKTDSISNIYSPISYLIEFVLIFAAFSFIIVGLLKNIEYIKLIATFRYISKNVKRIEKKLKPNKKDKIASKLLEDAKQFYDKAIVKEKEAITILIKKMTIPINLFIACSFISIFAYTRINISSNKTVIFLSIFWLLINILYFYLIYKDEYDKVKHLFKNVKKVEEFNEEKFEKYLNEKKIKKDIHIKDIFTDSNIFIMFRFVLYFMVFVVIALSFEIKFSRNNKLNIVNINEENYSIVYKTNDNIYYLDKVYYYNNRSIKVFVDKNKIIKSDNLAITTKEFDNVYLCKYNNNK